MVSNQISITEKFCKTATESIKSLEKLTMPYNILYAQKSKSVLGISRAGIQRGNLACHLSTWNRNTGFLSVDLFISTKKEEHTQDSGSISTSQYRL